MSEQETIEKLKAEGYNPVWAYEAEPGEVDEEHSHDYDTKLVILSGGIHIISIMGGAITDVLHGPGSEVIIPRNVLHSAKVGPEGCRYIVAEKH